MIVITGATGKLGAAIVQSLLTRMPAAEVGVSVRDAGKATNLAARGVRVRQGDFEDDRALAQAFEGADQVLVISTDRMGEPGVRASKAAIDAAVRAGVGRVFYTSHMGCSHESRFQACVDHAQVEEHLAASGTPWTALRNGFYASSALQFAEPGIAVGDVALPQDGPVSWTTHADLAAAAAAILAGEVTYEGPTPALTASGTATFEDIARLGAQATGHQVERTVVSDDAFLARMTGYGTPPVVAGQLLGIFTAARAGEFERTDPTLSAIIGRPTQTMRDLIGAEGDNA